MACTSVVVADMVHAIGDSAESARGGKILHSVPASIGAGSRVLQGTGHGQRKGVRLTGITVPTNRDSGEQCT